MDLYLGLEGFEEKIVSENDLASLLGNKGVDVLSSPAMIAFMELTCRKSVGPFLKEGETTLGISFNIDHLASAGIGSKIRVTSKLIEIHGKRLVFKVKCLSGDKVIGQGIHQRYIKNPKDIKKY
ncbi:MAG: thioesterase family protein [Anaerococcus sp.]|nr:thioesterase family protein [Anaerococcus sp.]